MNQRIQELAERAGGFPLYPEREEGDVSMGFRERALERFAELIVRECLDVVELRRSRGTTEVCKEECKAVIAEIKHHSIVTTSFDLLRTYNLTFNTALS